MYNPTHVYIYIDVHTNIYININSYACVQIYVHIQILNLSFLVIERANDSEYGLAAAVHTTSSKLSVKIANALEAGTVWINCYNIFYESMPFGGYKQSGIARDLGLAALQEYSEIKTVIHLVE